MTMRGRRPKPTNLKVLTGNPGRRPLNENEPSYPLSSLDPPDQLDDLAVAEWRRLVPILEAGGVLTDVDTATLTAYCGVYSTFMKAEQALSELAARDTTFDGLLVRTKNGNLIQNPLLGVRNTALDKMLKCAVELGMTPSSRSRIAADPGRSGGRKRTESAAAKYGF
jgi:P27 family predicted phage terminase small subunit